MDEIQVYGSEEIKKYWDCKFYLHNTPHAVAAFLGKTAGLTYVHEAMEVQFIEHCVRSAMDSLKKAMKIKNMADPDFMDYYTDKEIRRFKDRLLFDPISRVAREPLRKLRMCDRLIRAVKMLEETGQDPYVLDVTISIALRDAVDNYKEELIKLNIKNKQDILKKISGISPKDSLFKRLIKIDERISINENVVCLIPQGYL